MGVPGDATARIAELERLVATRTRDLQLAQERSKRQARLVSAHTAIALLARHGTLERAAPQMLEAFGQELDWQVVHLLMVDPPTQSMRCRMQWCAGPIVGALALASHGYAPDVGLPGRVWTTAKPQWLADLGPDTAGDSGLKSACAFPVIVDGQVHAIFEMFASDVRQVDEDLLETLGALGNQIGQWIEQARTRDQLRFNELQIARHIQTAILPRDLVVDGLEVSAMMVPATEVGGDYYDVLPFSGGAWFGIGDVSGHGVGAGMIMMMVQSAVAALTRDAKSVSPRGVVLDLNAFLYDNIRHRLREKDHVTFSLLRYTRDGIVRFAGAHEDLIIWRADRQRCEVIQTTGVWLGAVRSVAEMTRDQQLELEPGDILVLYTDGVIEARDSARELFGLKRLCAAIDELADATRPIAELCDAVLGKALQWCANQEDDISLVMARYHGEEIEYEIVSDHTVLQMDDL